MKKNRGRYQNDEGKQEKKAAKRKYLSYEDVPLEDYRDEEPVPADLTKKFLKMFLILFISVVAVLALMNIDKLTPDNIAHWFQYDLLGKSEGDGYPTGFSGSVVTKGNFDLISGVPVYCSDTSITVLNDNAGVYLDAQHSYAAPVLSVNNSHAIVYNLNATGYTVLKRDSIVRTSSVKQKILSADISSNGIYAILTGSDDYLSKLTVYRTDGLEKYTYSFADYYMNKVSVNKDGSRAVLTGISARNGGLISVIYVLDFTQDNYMQKYEVDDTFIYDIKYLDNGNAFAVGDDKSVYVNVNDGGIHSLSYDDRTLTAYAIKRDQGAVISLSLNPDGRSCDIVSFNRDGNRESEIMTDKRVISLDMLGNERAILTPDSIIVYDREGNTKGFAFSDSDARKIVCCDYNTFYVLGKSRISRLNAE